MSLSGVPEIRGLILKGSIVDLLHTEPACFLHHKFAKTIAKKYILTVRNAIYNSNCIQNAKMPEHCSTLPRGQGPFQHGNSTGTMPGTGYGKTFVIQFGTKRCLRILHKIYIITKNARTCSKCVKKC